MATFFGEILPVFSRAVEDDDEDFYIQDKNPREGVLRWASSLENNKKSSPHHKINCDLLIFGINSNVCAYIREHFLHDDDVPVGVLSLGFNNKHNSTLSQIDVNDQSCFIHKVPCDGKEVFTVLWQHSAQQESLPQAIAKIIDTFHSESLKVIILCTTLISNYITDRSEEEMGNSLVRSLKTDVTEEIPVFPNLEVPNSLTGVPAHVLTHCQVHRIQAILYVQYQDVLEKFSNLNAFQDILTSHKLQHFAKNKMPIIDRCTNLRSGCYI